MPTGSISPSFFWPQVLLLVETRIMKNNLCRLIQSNLAIFILIIIAAVFIMFTFFPPKIPLFKDPITGTYGIQ